jgi:glutathione S-transferase
LEKGLQWETTWLDLPSGEHKKPEYLAINPVGKVPALIDDGVIVHDSTIINEYLEDKFPQNNLLPADPVARARARKFEDYADAYLMPSLFNIFWELRKLWPELAGLTSPACLAGESAAAGSSSSWDRLAHSKNGSSLEFRHTNCQLGPHQACRQTPIVAQCCKREILISKVRAVR